MQSKSVLFEAKVYISQLIIFQLEKFRLHSWCYSLKTIKEALIIKKDEK